MYRTNITKNTLITGAAVSLLSLTTQAFAACNAQLVSYAVGNSLPPTSSPAFQAALDSYMNQTGAAQVRGVAPSGITTKDYKSDALWVWYDNANKITKFECGH